MEYPFNPPKPFSDRLSNLRSSKQIKVTRLWATAEPKWMTNSKKRIENDEEIGKERNEVAHASSTSFSSIEYKIAYKAAKALEDSKKKKKNRKKNNGSISKDIPPMREESTDKIESKDVPSPPLTALSSLQCLVDSNCIEGPIYWSYEPSNSDEFIEVVRLTVNGMVSEQKRCLDGQLQRRKDIKQLLASNILEKIIGSHWESMTVDQLRSSLKPEL